jgi:acetolactate synthase-1/2/3 large subunit
VQEDETALVLWALWRHFQRFRDVEFLKRHYRGLVIRAANWLVEYRDPESGLPLASWDLWEERRGMHAWTLAATWAGLRAAANFATAFGESHLAAVYHDAAAEILTGAEAPLVHAGSGVLWARATEELAAVAELLAAPVTTSWGGRDTVDERDTWALPLWASATVDAARNDADVVLALGTRFGETDWWGKAPYWRDPAQQRLIQVDVDDASLGLNKPTDLAIAADARVFLGLLVDELKNRDLTPALARRQGRLQRYAEQKAGERAELDQALSGQDEGHIRSASVAAACGEAFPDDAVCVLDGGNAAVWGNLFHEVRVPHTLLGTYKFGMLGAGTAQALAAKLVHPDRVVYCITGDGAFGFHPQEMETAVREGLPVIVLVLVDGQWGMVKVNQEFALDADTLLTEGGLPAEQTINADFAATRFDLLAESLGAVGARARTLPELRAVLDEVVASGRPAVVQVEVDAKTHKFAPMLMRFREMHLEPQG